MKQKLFAMMVLGLFITSVIVLPAVTVAYAGDQEQVEAYTVEDGDDESMDEEGMDEGTQSSDQEEWAEPEENVIDQD